jgi:molybdopterin/thiamine biosynthesis adenylyltransferase
VLDSLRLLEDTDRMDGLTEAQRLRHFSNLAFFRTFSSLDTSAEDMVRRLRSSHVLLLGVGGLGSNVLQNLCGLGVGRLTLVDRDVVEEKNFARQFVYRSCDIGRVKVERAAEWVREFDPAIEVAAIQAEFTSADDVAKLVDSVAADAVSAGVDYPAEIDLWVNAACVAASVPFCRAGMSVTESMTWSVDPGRSACLACYPDMPGDRGVGPVATHLGSLVAFELTRFLTGFTPPAYAGAMALFDLTSGCAQTVVRADRNSRCLVCGDVTAASR